MNRANQRRLLPKTVLVFIIVVAVTANQTALDLPVPPAYGQSFVLGQTLTNPTPDAGDQFGLTAAEIGNNILIGAPWDDALAIDSGAAYLFDRSTGALLLGLPNPNPGPNPGDQFARAVASVGTNILIGSAFDDFKGDNAGAAYLFNGTTGALIHTFYDPSPAPRDGFGRSVAALGNNILIGAHQKSIGTATEAGVVHLFDGITGAHIRTFQKPNPFFGDNFGRSVAATNNRVIVGAPLDDAAGTDSGAAYVFDGTTGNLIHTLLNPTPAFEDEFGETLQVAGNIVIIGSHQDDAGAMNSGVVHFFDISTGSHIRTIQNPTPATGDKFARSIAVIGTEKLLIGAPFDGTNALEAGSAYLFSINTGELLQSFHNPNPNSRDRFGWSVQGIGDEILIGAPYDDTGAADAGVAFLFGTDPNLQPPGSNPPPPILGLPPFIFYLIVGSLAIEAVVAIAIIWRRKKSKTPLPVPSI